MSYSFTFTLVILVLSNALLAQVHSTDTQDLARKIDSVFTTVMESEHIPGAAYIVVKDGRVILKRGYGYTSLGEEIQEVNPDATIFRIGSVTKTFTAMALMQLVDAGKVDLNAPVSKYLKDITIPNNFKTPIRVAHLMNHSAGLDELPGRRVYDSTTRIPLKEFLKDKLVSVREPGIISSYSSYGIALAGLLVEEISGQTLEDYMQEHIWKPLEMHSTTMQLTEAMEENLSWGYEYQNGINVPMPWEYYHTYPASDINSTVVDMGNYMIAHLQLGKFKNLQVLSETSAIQMHDPELRVHKQVASFAYGFYQEPAQGFNTVSHGGDMLGYASYLAMVPEEQLGIYVVHHHEGTRMRYQILDVILSHFSKGQLIENPVEQRISEVDISRLAGRYQWTTHCHSCTSGWKPEIHDLTDNKDGTFSIFNRTFYPIAPLLFKSTDGERTMGFVENSDGEIQFMSTGGVNVFEKIKE